MRGAKDVSRVVKAPRGSTISCKGWQQEAAMRMLMNNLDPDVAENPLELVVYGGRGKAARNWEAFEAIVRSLKELENDETLCCAVRETRRSVSHPWACSESTNIQLNACPKVGYVGDLLGAGRDGSYHVRTDDCRELDLHRHPRYLARNV
jgi:hypothetical protein